MKDRRNGGRTDPAGARIRRAAALFAALVFCLPSAFAEEKPRITREPLVTREPAPLPEMPERDAEGFLPDGGRGGNLGLGGRLVGRTGAGSQRQQQNQRQRKQGKNILFHEKHLPFWQ